MNTQTQGQETRLASPFAGIFASWMLPLRVEQNADGFFEVWSKRDEKPGSKNNFVLATCQFEDEAQFFAAAPALAASHAALYSALADVMAEADFGDAELSRKCNKALSDARNLTAGMEGSGK